MKEEKMKIKFSEYELLGGVIVLIIIGALLLNLFWANPTSAEFCGNGVCSNNEIGKCQIDCDWCGDGYCQEGESCSSCEKDCNSCSATSFCGDGICGVGECVSGCWKDCSYLQCENGVCEPDKGENCVSTPNDCKCLDGYCNAETMQCAYQSCGNGICDSQETFLNCPNDCKGEQYQTEDTSDINYPLIFVHGHSTKESDSGFSLNAFSSMQSQLDSSGLYEDRGYILASDERHEFQAEQWANTNKPISLRTTYYFGEYSSVTDPIAQDDNYPISEYSKRLDKVVDNVLYATGKNKVIIVAHSMGGLVSKYYIENLGGVNKVDKIIMIGTPNHGIYGYIAFGCESLLGRSTYSPECADMQYNSTFIASLNAGDETPGDIAYLTIAGNCKNDLSGFAWDEVVRVGSVQLDGAINYVIEGDCIPGISNTFHFAMLDYNLVPESYNRLVSFI